MDVSLSCEAIRMEPGVSFFADAVEERDGARAIRPFVHFHPQVELVWFRHVSGHVQIDGASFPITGGQAVLLPAMQVHAFMTGEAYRHWVLIQFESLVVETVLRQPLCRVLNQPCIATPDRETAARIDMLCDWLVQIRRTPAHGAEAQRVLELILLLVAASAEGQEQPIPDRKGSQSRLHPAIAMVHADPRRAPGLVEAARACNLTGGYFSRIFKEKMGMGYANYVQMHRLNLSARRLLASDEPIAQIAYAVGFASPAHFSTSFVERFGVSPRIYRKVASPQRWREQKIES
jgi:AraC-like DNA-binding protein